MTISSKTISAKLTASAAIAIALTGAASADVSTATSAADMGATAHPRTTLSKALARQRKDQRHCRGGTQNFQTVHDQTPFPASQPYEKPVVPWITPVCVQQERRTRPLYLA